MNVASDVPPASRMVAVTAPSSTKRCPLSTLKTTAIASMSAAAATSARLIAILSSNYSESFFDTFSEKILDFHNAGGKHDLENSIRLKRKNGIETVCITQIEIYPEAKYLFYNDLENNTSNRLVIY